MDGCQTCGCQLINQSRIHNLKYRKQSKRIFMIRKLIRTMALSTALLFSVFLPVRDSLASVPAPKVSWHKSYGGRGEESHPHYVIQTKDRGFLMVGETGFVEDRSARIFLVKTDRVGDLIWKREFGKRGHNLGNCVSEAMDGHYLIAGCLNLDAALIKVDADSGKTLWTRTWNLGTEDAFEGLTVTPDGGILATGYKNGLAEGTFLNWGKGVLLKTNSEGKEEWRRDLSKYTSSGYRIKPSAGGFLLACHPKDEGSDGRNLLKVDGEGRVLWAKTYNTVYWGFDTKLNGETLLAGHTLKSDLSKNWDAELTVVDRAGKPLWTKFFGQPRGYDGRWIHDEVWGARSTPDGGWLVVAGTGDETRLYEKSGHPSGSSGQWKVYLIKTDAKGRLEWEGIYGSRGEDWAGEDLCITADGGALVANDCGAFGFTKISPFVQKGKNSKGE
jgi:hypothetical protein